jgi:uncharacterized membrane protein
MQADKHAGEAPDKPHYSSADIGALAHLYRGELYRSKIWRMRLDTTTNWAVVTTGIVFSVVYAQPDASAAPLAIVGLVLLVFLLFEARRYRFFDIWRVRVRVLETHFMTPLLLGRGVQVENGWHEALAEDYTGVYFHLTFWEAFGRRLRRNYGYIFLIQGASYYGKILIHPTPAVDLQEVIERAALGPIPGEVALLSGFVFYLALFTIALVTRRHQKAVGRGHRPRGEDRVVRFAKTELY